MDNKTKVKVAVVIGIVILAVIFIIMVVFVKGNRTPVNKNIPRKGEKGYQDPTQKEDDTGEEEPEPTGEPVTLEDVMSLGIKDGNLVEIHSDLSSTIVRKMESGYTEFCYGDNCVYTLVDNEDGTYSVIETDLSNSAYPDKTIMTTDAYGHISNIEYYAGKIYFVSEKRQLIEYSISESFSKAFTNENEVSSFVINRTNNSMILSYRPEGQNAGIYILDFTSNSFTPIVTLNDLAGRLILNGKTLVIDIKEFQKLYVYDLEQNTVLEVGADNVLASVENHITFYNDLLLYTDGSAIDIRDASGNAYQIGWYVLNDGTIADISMLSSSQLQIARYDANGSKKITRSLVINLSDATMTELDSVYTGVIRMK